MDLVELSSVAFAATSKSECKAELAAARWSDGFVCRECGNNKAYFLKKRGLFECANRKCKKQTSASAGTQFHNSKRFQEQWQLIGQYKENLSTTTKAVIKKAMNVSAGTARRVRRIITLSFPEQQRTCNRSENEQVMSLVAKAECKHEAQHNEQARNQVVREKTVAAEAYSFSELVHLLNNLFIRGLRTDPFLYSRMII